MKDLTQLQKRKIKSNIPLYVLLFPSIILLIMFAYIPMLGLVIAFKDYSPANGIFKLARGQGLNISPNSLIQFNSEQR